MCEEVNKKKSLDNLKSKPFSLTNYEVKWEYKGTKTNRGRWGLVQLLCIEFSPIHHLIISPLNLRIKFISPPILIPFSTCIEVLKILDEVFHYYRRRLWDIESKIFELWELVHNKLQNTKGSIVEHKTSLETLIEALNKLRNGDFLKKL